LSLQCTSPKLAHTDEIQRSSKCQLLRVDRKRLTYGQNDATGEQALETAPRQDVVSNIFEHKEVRYGDNSHPGRS
jgi:hypothetical protein